MTKQIIILTADYRDGSNIQRFTLDTHTLVKVELEHEFANCVVYAITTKRDDVEFTWYATDFEIIQK